MALQMTLDTLEGLDENTTKLYVEKDGKFTLDITGDVKSDIGDKVPLSRLNQEIEKRKESIKALQDFCDNLVEAVPEDKRSIIPDLPPAKKISWLQDALKMDFFGEQKVTPLDTKRPGAEPGKDFSNMTPQAIMATGYKTK